MIFELLRCSTFDKLEDGILAQLTWMLNLLVGIYDVNLTNWNDNIMSWNITCKLWYLKLVLNSIYWNDGIVPWWS
jgi:hypothetical protein